MPRSNRPVPAPTPRCIPDMADVAAYLVPNAPYNPDHSHFEPGDGNDSEEDGNTWSAAMHGHGHYRHRTAGPSFAHRQPTPLKPCHVVGLPSRRCSAVLSSPTGSVPNVCALRDACVCVVLKRYAVAQMPQIGSNDPVCGSTYDNCANCSSQDTMTRGTAHTCGFPANNLIPPSPIYCTRASRFGSGRSGEDAGARADAVVRGEGRA